MCIWMPRAVTIWGRYALSVRRADLDNNNALQRQAELANSNAASEFLPEFAELALALPRGPVVMRMHEFEFDLRLRPNSNSFL